MTPKQLQKNELTWNPDRRPSPLRRRTASGFLWTSSAALIARLVQVVTTLVLARLLVPEDFGLVSVALVVINSLALIRDMGLSQALIFRRGDVESAANTAFALLPGVGAVLAALAFITAPATSSFLGIPGARAIIQVLSLSLLVGSFGLVPAALMERELRFRRRFLPEVIPYAGYAVAAITGAMAGLGAWSLVAGELTRSLLVSTVIWPFSLWRPRLRFSLPLARDLFSYGRHILGASLTIFLFTIIDNAGIAKWLGAEQLGFYVLAFTLGTLPAAQIAMSAGRVLFPAFTSIGHDRRSLAHAYYHVVSCISAVAAPIAVATLVMGPVFLGTLYGDKWDGSITALQILSFYGFFRAIGGSAGEVLKAVGRPRLLATVAYLQLALVILPLYPVLTRWGIEGAAVLFSLSMLAGVCLAIFIASREIQLGLVIIASRTLVPLLLTVPAAAAAYTIAFVSLEGVGAFPLLAGSTAFLIIYMSALYSVQRAVFDELTRMARQMLARSG